MPWRARTVPGASYVNGQSAALTATTETTYWGLEAAAAGL